MRKILPLLIMASLLGASPLAYSRGGGGSGGPSAAAHSNGPSPKSQAAENSNGRFSTDRDKGLDRAEDRMSAQGTAHEKAATNTKKHLGNARNAGDRR